MASGVGPRPYAERVFAVHRRRPRVGVLAFFVTAVTVAVGVTLLLDPGGSIAPTTTVAPVALPPTTSVVATTVHPPTTSTTTTTTTTATIPPTSAAATFEVGAP